MADRSMGPRGRAPVGAGKGKMDFKVLGRLMRMLFRDEPVRMSVITLCVVLTALIGVAPAAYSESVTRCIEQGLQTGWSSIAPELGSLLLMRKKKRKSLPMHSLSELFFFLSFLFLLFLFLFFSFFPSFIGFFSSSS